MKTRISFPLFLILSVWSGRAPSGAAEPKAEPLADKTLVVWASPATLDQRGGTALTIDDGAGAFDGIVFGEVEARRWMPGSDLYRRTEKKQAGWPAETAAPDAFVQIAIVYRGRDIEDARIYDRALDRETIAALVPGEGGDTPAPWAWWSFADEGLRERTGRFDEIKLIGDLRIESGCLVLEGGGATVIASSPDPSAPGAARIRVPREWSATGPVPEEVVRSTRLFRERLLADPYRPLYHFCVPEDMGRPGDPNGAFYAGGRYHLMYLYNRSGYNRSGSGFCWGHISSRDLLHWRHHPDAIGPGDGDEGCFSGGAFVDDDGAAYLSYWMLWGDKGIGLARSEPGFDTWTKLPENPAIRSTEWGVTEAKDRSGKTIHYGSADPSNIWRARA
ncbi:MAG: glycoside hydrolase family 32 protein [Planctomycetes bacterium]|nr:glycoside hydrolase family 32 protein [Planctomycetota bacterium]